MSVTAIIIKLGITSMIIYFWTLNFPVDVRAVYKSALEYRSLVYLYNFISMNELTLEAIHIVVDFNETLW